MCRPFCVGYCGSPSPETCNSAPYCPSESISFAGVLDILGHVSISDPDGTEITNTLYLGTKTLPACPSGAGKYTFSQNILWPGCYVCSESCPTPTQTPEPTQNQTGSPTLTPVMTHTPITFPTTGNPADIPVANFIGTPCSGTAPLIVSFNDTSTGDPIAWKWSFGDGKTSMLQNPSHNYTAAGTYDVRLTASNVAGGNTVVKEGYVTVTEPAQIEYKVYAEAAENENVYLMARGFWNELKGSNHDESVIWTDWQGSTDIIDYSSAYESHWTSNANQWVEQGDFAYFSGHGSPNVFWFRNFTESADASRISLGSGRTKWAVIDACLSLDYSSWQNWNPSFNGLHMLLGWNTTTVPSFDSNAEGRGFVFARLMKHDYAQNTSQMNIIDAWEWAGKYTWGNEPTTSDHDIFNAAIYDTNCRYDYLPGWIPNGGSVCTELSGTRGYQSVLIFKKNRESNTSKESMSIVEGTYSVQTSVPVTNNSVFTYVPVKPEYSKDWVISLAKSLGMSGDIRETDDAFYAGETDAQQYYFEVRKDTSAISFQKFNGRSGLPQSESESITAVNAFLRKNDLLLPDMPEPEVLNNVGESISPYGERHVDWKTNVITYPQMIDGLPVFNAQFTVEVDSDNSIIGLWRNWRDYQHSQEITLKSPETVFNEFKSRHDSDKKGEAEQTRVTEISLGYVMQPSPDDEGTLQPVYLIEGNDQVGIAKESFDPVTINAKKKVIRTYNVSNRTN
jgi:PKD repeat protein